MSLFEDTNPRELKELLRQINARESALPDFQRDFVWEPYATQELVVSIANNYPAGSLLRIRNTQNLFACREFAGAPALDGQHATYLVLDGQQRLTSLYQAFFGCGDHRYFLDLRKLIGGADIEECVFFRRANQREAQMYTDSENQARDLVLPLNVLKGGAGDFSRWSRAVARSVAGNDERIRLEDQLAEIEEKWIRTIDDYKFPVVTLTDRVSADAVCTIFETLNRTGVKLSVFELLTARFWPLGINLRNLWERAQADYPIIADFDVDPYYALQAISLAGRPVPSCKRGDVLDLTGDAINQWWERVIGGLAKSMEVLRDDCGVITARWLPYKTIVPPLAAVLASYQPEGPAAVGAARNKLARWFWCVVFSQAYDSAANSQSAKDVTELLRWLGNGEPPHSVAGFTMNPVILRDVTVRQRALYSGAICLVLRHRPRDFHNAAQITGDLMVEHHIDDHHIFPNAYLGRNNVQQRLRDCVLNRTLIDRDTNKRIQDRAPSAYLAEVREALGVQNFGQLLDSHLLPSAPDSVLLQDDFDAFLTWRQNKLWDEIKLLTGFVEPPPAAGN